MKQKEQIAFAEQLFHKFQKDLSDFKLLSFSDGDNISHEVEATHFQPTNLELTLSVQPQDSASCFDHQLTVWHDGTQLFSEKHRGTKLFPMLPLTEAKVAGVKFKSPLLFRVRNGRLQVSDPLGTG